MSNPDLPDALPPDIQASVDAAIESLKREELEYARAFAKIWEEGFLACLDEKHQQNDNPYLRAAQDLEKELGVD